MKHFLIVILIIIAVFVYSEKKDAKEQEYKYEIAYEQGYDAGQKEAIAEIMEEAHGWERYVETEQLQDVLSEEVGDDMRDIIMSYVVEYDKSVIVEEVIMDSGYEY